MGKRLQKHSLEWAQWSSLEWYLVVWSCGTVQWKWRICMSAFHCQAIPQGGLYDTVHSATNTTPHYHILLFCYQWGEIEQSFERKLLMDHYHLQRWREKNENKQEKSLTCGLYEMVQNLLHLHSPMVSLLKVCPLQKIKKYDINVLFCFWTTRTHCNFTILYLFTQFIKNTTYEIMLFIWTHEWHL